MSIKSRVVTESARILVSDSAGASNGYAGSVLALSLNKIASTSILEESTRKLIKLTSRLYVISPGNILVKSIALLSFAG